MDAVKKTKNLASSRIRSAAGPYIDWAILAAENIILLAATSEGCTFHPKSADAQCLGVKRKA
jgi:hypothetical protein